MPRLKPERIAGEPGWWLVPHDPPIGPFATKGAARDAKGGIVAFYRSCRRPGWVTSEIGRVGGSGNARKAISPA